ncbi:MAG: hypothetical protein ACI4NF_07015 [Christensenellales bacterium]
MREGARALGFTAFRIARSGEMKTEHDIASLSKIAELVKRMS